MHSQLLDGEYKGNYGDAIRVNKKINSAYKVS